MSTKVLPNYKDKKSHYYICVFLITAILAIKKHCYICAFMDTKVPPNDKDKMIYEISVLGRRAAL